MGGVGRAGKGKYVPVYPSRVETQGCEWVLLFENRKSRIDQQAWKIL